MKIQLLLWVILIPYLTHSQNLETKGKPLPKNLDETFSYLESTVKTTDLIRFKNQNEKDATYDWYNTIGLWMRNNWIRGHRNPALIKYFSELGVPNPDDISAIIITSFHRKLNNKEIGLKSQVAHFKAYWSNIDACDEKRIAAALIQYKKFHVNDPITILMPVDTSYHQRNVVQYECPNIDWIFSPKIDLKIDGVVIEKYFKHDNSYIFFKIKINKMNFPKTALFGDSVKIGSVVDFQVKYLKIAN